MNGANGVHGAGARLASVPDGDGDDDRRADGAGSGPAGVSERRLLRLAFDLHDGALQSVVGLATDLRLFRMQLSAVLEDGHRELLLGRVDDLDARLLELERELRELAESLEPRSLLERPFTDVLRDELDSFSERSGVATALRLDGDFSELTASQRLALLRVVQEALTNAREHGAARSAAVTVIEDGAGVRLEVRDDGRGFAVEAARRRADAEGRLGLSGMHQRVALLGGSLDVGSRPGGPTVVSALLPRWRPGEAAPLPS